MLAQSLWLATDAIRAGVTQLRMACWLLVDDVFGAGVT
jgi:hypothetical protein